MSLYVTVFLSLSRNWGAHVIIQVIKELLRHPVSSKMFQVAHFSLFYLLSAGYEDMKVLLFFRMLAEIALIRYNVHYTRGALPISFV